MSPLTESTRVVLKQPTGASWRITPTYTPAYPTSPADAEEWTDPNTDITWVYSSATQSWSQV